MDERIPFLDLAGPQRTLTPQEDSWLAELAAETKPAEHVVHVAASLAGEQPGPLLERQLDGTWRAGRYVGELRRGDRILDIQPRLHAETIARWVSSIVGVRVVPRSAENVRAGSLIAELLAGAWKAAVIDASRHGPPGLRAHQIHVGPTAKGRLDVAGTVKLRARRIPYVSSVSRPKAADNPISRSIVLAERSLAGRIHRPDWRGDRIEEILPRLQGATGRRPPLPSRRALDRVRYTPITLPYKRAAELSWNIARNRGLRSAATADKTDGYLIDIAELWELFLLHCARRAFGTRQVTHGTRIRAREPRAARTLLYSYHDSKRTMGRLYPDILIGPIEGPRAIIDAKYKPLADPRGVDREDLYQLGAYLTAYPSEPPPRGALAFVDLGSHDQRSARAIQHGPWRTHTNNHVTFRRMPVDEDRCVEAFRDAFG